MARIRTIIPDFWEDDRFVSVSLPAILLYIGMKNFADDSGVIVANEIVIKSKVFPAREDIRKQQVSGWLKELIENSILVPFEYDNKGYYVMDFSNERIDKPQKSKVPPEVIEQARRERKSIPESSRTIESIPSVEESIGEEWKGVGVELSAEGSDGPACAEPTPPPIGELTADPKEDSDFNAFQTWIKKHAPTVAKMKEPFTKEEYLRLRTDFSPQQVSEMLTAMHNWEPLLKKCKNSNLTFRKWAKKDFNQEGNDNSNPTGRAASAGGVRRRSTEVSPDYKADILKRLGAAGSPEEVQ